MSSPFNSVAELKQRTSFAQGQFGTEESVLNATFEFNQFENALQDARDFISSRTLNKSNADFSTVRLNELKHAERFFALAQLYMIFGETIPAKAKDANAAGVAELNLGADTPSPDLKGRFWVNFMSEFYRKKGMALLIGQPWDIQLGKDIQTDRFPCHLPNRVTSPELVCTCN